MIDTVAEILISYHDVASKEKIQAFAWMTRVLGQSTSGRYADVLAEVKEYGSHKKLRKYARRALQDHGEANGEQYQQGMLDKPVPDFSF